jgi:hypothetical protein
VEQRVLHNEYFAPTFVNVAAYYYSVLGAAVIAAARLKPRLFLATLRGLWDVIRAGGGGLESGARTKAK